MPDDPNSPQNDEKRSSYVGRLLGMEAVTVALIAEHPDPHRVARVAARFLDWLDERDPPTGPMADTVRDIRTAARGEIDRLREGAASLRPRPPGSVQ